MLTKCKHGIPTLTEMLADIGIPVLTEIFRGSESKFPEVEPYFFAHQLFFAAANLIFFAHGMCFPRLGTVEREAASRKNLTQGLEFAKQLGLNSKSNVTFCNRSCYKFFDVAQTRQQRFTTNNGCVCEVLHLCRRICSNKNCKT